MQSSNNTLKKYRINADVLCLFQAAKSIGWHAVRESSIHRILYLSSVLYAFRSEQTDSDNPFGIYRFSIDKTGPYDSDISRSLEFLYKDEYLERPQHDDTYVIGNNVQPGNARHHSADSSREEWIQIVVHILGIYSENRIYDFVFRDPEYQRVLKTNTQQGLDTDSDNQTATTLRSFKEEFEAALPGEVDSFSNQQYIELYFEYIFSKILKRDIV